MSRLLRALITLSSLPIYLPICTQAHMQMSSPFPLRSPLDPAVPVELKDYDNTFPLKSDGSNFACKHYQSLDQNSQAYDIKATYQAGNIYSLQLAGTATHMGGSCQISISYDNGATFKVIESIIGGCPLTSSYDFTIPTFAPSSDTALLSWSWFNIVGNREMYQNCARVKILGTGGQRYRRTSYKRQASMNDLPDMFVCNVGNGCRTNEGKEVVFPNPGNNVQHGQDAVTPQPGPGFSDSSISSGNTNPTVTASTLSLTTTTAPFPISNTTTSIRPSGTVPGNFYTVLTSTSRTTGFATVTTFSTMTTASSTVTSVSASPTATMSPGACTVGEFVCNSPSSFSQCVSNGSGSTSYIYMGLVAGGMQCTNGQITRQNAGPCTPSASLFCKGDKAFYMCDQGGLIEMGPVPAGTSCRNGVIGFA